MALECVISSHTSLIAFLHFCFFLFFFVFISILKYRHIRMLLADPLDQHGDIPKGLTGKYPFDADFSERFTPMDSSICKFI